MMDDRNTLFSQQTFTAAVELIWREAELLDRKDYRAWLDLWTPSGFYVVPIDHATTDFASTLNYVFDDQDMREKRVQRMVSGYSASASDAARTVRTVSRFTLTSDAADVVEVNSSQVIVACKRGTTTLFAADLTHRIRFTDGEPRIEQKVIRLIDSNEALNAIGFLL
ncbi:aromatic-ring-hydroxylating dioxygenase subunit beta [Paraburkholderia saeva]|uniref:p-cumate 2,3-dioxygenase system, small oxygenase component n=1 Tax=Paraburkholderia saeva TaxID=2777537 RepID=A0A9N8RX19_9BURK|nr:aromatic-ring-hydroxylating dioxygenase subunit beta [Paraburkholderia saeva]CAG4897197.1 p-cumate 2,3-dioxygenase system, small oxygenase component [Paraburkholderia saeva]CAG4920068.1 p-cumate 2,3-dioxygenase system, small oxygenase component [Paraburkholderia saeva]